MLALMLAPIGRSNVFTPGRILVIPSGAASHQAQSYGYAFLCRSNVGV